LQHKETKDKFRIVVCVWHCEL